MFGLGHIDVGPLLYGVVIFVGFYSMWWKLTHGRLLTFVIEVFVFVTATESDTRTTLLLSLSVRRTCTAYLPGFSHFA